MSNQLNILFLCSWYPSRETNNLGNFIRRHALAVSTIHKVTVLFVTESEESGTEEQKNGNLTERIVYFKRNIPLVNYYRTASSQLSKLLSEQKFDLAHLHVIYPAALLTHLLNIPWVVSEHFSGYHPESGFRWGLLKKKIALKALNNVAYVLPVSLHLARSMRRFGVRNRFKRISNVVNTETFFPDQSSANDRFTFLHVSSLEERSKNINGILQAFKIMQDLEEDFLLKIGGDGDLDELKQKIKTSGLQQENVEILGNMSLEIVADKMRSSNALVMFSHFENQPCTILEALCCGLPVISSDVGGIPEVVDERNGILLKNRQPEALTRALIRMKRNYHRYDKDKIAKDAAEKYSVPVIAREISAVYLNVLNADSSNP